MKNEFILKETNEAEKASQSYVELLPRKGQQYELNLHAHSTVSDGNFSPAQLKNMYMEEGYIIFCGEREKTFYKKFSPSPRTPLPFSKNLNDVRIEC
ncbi:MAG: hypothetical protein IJW29_00400 [Clostridia bacterium]|nr:hypothetical protein [Clostridia bacterium]